MKIVLDTKYLKHAVSEAAVLAIIVAIVLGPFGYSFTLATPALFLSLLSFWAFVIFVVGRYYVHQSRDLLGDKQIGQD